MEIWKQSKDVQRLEVSNCGNIRCYKTKRTWYTKPDKLGYICGQYRIDGKIYSFKVHRLVAIEFVDNPLQLVEVNHIDGNKENNNASNLEWCTRSHNVQHAFDLGLKTGMKGVSNGRAILTEDIVIAVCEYFAESPTNTPKKASEKFQISIQQASKIRAKLAWKHITENFTFVPLRRPKFNDQSKDVASSEAKRETRY